jgi:hypothetical protein
MKRDSCSACVAEDAIALKRPHGGRRRSLVLGLFALGAAIGLAATLYGPAKNRYLAHVLTSAQTPAQELEAFYLVHQWGGIYHVRYYNSDGLEVLPYQSGFGTVRKVVVQWHGFLGVTATRSVLDTNNLRQLTAP